MIDENFTCKICNKEHKSLISLSHHIKRKHKVNIRDYYDTYLKNKGDDLCAVCKKTVERFLDLRRGYQTTCGSKCAGRYNRQKLREDPKKFESFKNKVKNNQTNIWTNRKETGEDKRILKKRIDTVKNNNKGMTKQQLKERYGWLNKLSGKARKEKIKEITEPLKKFYETSSEEIKQNVYDKRVDTRIKRGQIVPLSEKSAFKQYEAIVRNETEKTYRKNVDIIDPERKRGNDFHLDHIISIQYGFMNNVDTDVISNVNNLRVISAKENMTKKTSCDMKVEVLLELIKHESEK
jgi:hypothetical protein